MEIIYVFEVLLFSFEWCGVKAHYSTIYISAGTLDDALAAAKDGYPNCRFDAVKRLGPITPAKP